MPELLELLNGIQTQIVNGTCHEIIKFAKENNVDTIVFEYLGKMRMPHGFYGAKRLRRRLHFWCKQRIQKKTEEMAHAHGMRVSHVLAAGTSMYAFDGSGKVTRSPRKDICKFQSVTRKGKEYHADLNASYNIGARFFIKALLLPLPEDVKLFIANDIPEILDRKKQTLDTLLSLIEAMKILP